MAQATAPILDSTEAAVDLSSGYGRNWRCCGPQIAGLLADWVSYKRRLLSLIALHEPVC